MKTLWTILSVLAIANLLAVAGVAAWLFGTGRLDQERVTALRQILSEPVEAERTRIEAAAAEVEQAGIAAAQAVRDSAAPLSAAEQLQVRLDLSEVDHQRIERLRQETRDLTVTMSREQERMAEERRAFESERSAFEAMRAQLASVEGSAQFRRAVATLQSLKPEEAVAILSEMMRPGTAPINDATDGVGSGMAGGSIDGSIGGGGGMSVPAFGGGVDQVVSYLNALEERSRNKIMAEFTGTDPALAADLLERLRTRGLIAHGPE